MIISMSDFFTDLLYSLCKLFEITFQNRWIGGYIAADHEVRGFESLKHILSPHFELIEDQEMPFIIRETVRKHQWSVAHATVWKRTATTVQPK